MSFLSSFSKTSASLPTVALRPSFHFHRIKMARAFSLFPVYSTSIFSSLAAEIPSLSPTSYQQFPTSSLISVSCISVTAAFLGSDVAE